MTATTLRAAPVLGALALLACATVPVLAQPPTPDVVVDANRDGALDLTGPTDRTDEDTATLDRGAVFLANIDDDSSRCRAGMSPVALYLGRARLAIDRRLASCNDAADERVNGDADLLDMAQVAVAAMPALSDAATGRITVTTGARLFLQGPDGAYTAVPRDGAVLTAAALRAGVRARLEGLDILRDTRRWNGTVTVTVSVTDAGETRTDTAMLRVAPVLFQHDLMPAVHVFSGSDQPSREPSGKALRAQLKVQYKGVPNAAAQIRRVLAQNARSLRVPRAFNAALAPAVTDLGGPTPPAVTVLNVGEQWIQDLFEAGYASMPGAGGTPHTMRVLLRSPTAVRDGSSSGLRTAARVVFARLRGPDVGAVQVFRLKRPATVDDSLGSTGNFEALPPYRTATASYPRGRMLWGSGASRRPDHAFVRMLRAQGTQAPVVVDTSWLDVAHVDEVVHVVSAPNARGWTLMVADPRLAVDVLRRAQRDGHGDVRMFRGRREQRPGDKSPRASARSIDEVLADRKLLNANARAAAKIDGMLDVLLRETGLAESDLVRAPVMFRAAPPPGKTLTAYTPDIVNGLSVGPRAFLAPAPNGPVVDGEDLLARTLREALAAVGVRTAFIEEWDWLHNGEGEVHCGTNALRDISGVPAWWAPPQPAG